MRLARFFVFPAIILLSLLAGCASVPTPERIERPVLPYQVRVRPTQPAEITPDGFEARFVFDVISTQDLKRNSLVQELRQSMTLEYKNGKTRTRRITLVEAFRLRLTHVDGSGRYHYQIFVGQSDRHAMRGIKNLPDEVIGVTIERNVFAYVANVAGADFTPNGFAQLPRNQDGTLVSKVPDGFNTDYQDGYDTRGWVDDSGDALGLTYRIRYHLTRTGGGRMHFVIDRADGHGVVEPTNVIEYR